MAITSAKNVLTTNQKRNVLTHDYHRNYRHAGRVFPHPHVSYANLRPGVTLKATLAEGEDVGEATRTLQTMAESLVEAHQQFMAKAIEDAYARERAEE
jgi:hypothetical protein